MSTVDHAKEAYERHAPNLLDLLASHRLSKDSLDLLLIAFKDQDQLQVYAKRNKDSRYQILKTFDILNRSGVLGPKKEEGDKQVPEGKYYINRFNPNSKYHLSLGLNFPNAYDMAQGYTGSDIFIHGGIETVGCLPMGDTAIEELYTLASFAKSAGQIQIPVYIFPFPLSDENMSIYAAQYSLETVSRWKELQRIFQKLMESIRND